MNRTQFFYLVAACVATAFTASGCVANPPQSGSNTNTPPQSGSTTTATPQSGSNTTATAKQATDWTFTLPADAHPGLRDPSKAKFETPENFQAKFETTKGDFVIEVTREWAPNGADRFYSMVQVGYFKNTAIFRAIDNFMFQFGIHGIPEVAKAWQNTPIKDDKPAGKSNVPGTISFAQTGAPNSRSSQMFINLGDNGALDRGRNGGAGFYPFGQVIKGKEVINKINVEYDENRGNVQGEFVNKGNAYIQNKFPRIDYIKRVTIVPAEGGSGTQPAAGSGTTPTAGSGTTPTAGSGTTAPAGSGTTGSGGR